MKHNYNNCARNHCDMSRKPLAIKAEQLGTLPCFVEPRRPFKFKDCISKITISDAKSPIVQWFMNHA